MPSGETHTKINLIALPILAVGLISYGLTTWLFLLWFCGGFVIGTYFLSPDLDTHSSPYRKWGVLRVIWYPYKVIMPHRSVLTHTFIIGDLIRLAYLGIVISPLLYIVNETILDGALMTLIMPHKLELLMAFIGVIAASALHIIADIVSTKRKRLFRRKRRRR